MATWHQLQRPVQLWAENELTVVIDPPNEPRCLALFSTQREANQYASKFRNALHVYVLPPRCQ